MNLLIRLSWAFSLATLVGCASLPKSDGWAAFEKRKAAAVQVYSAGSTVAGGRCTLLLLKENRWERWGADCTETSKGNEGTYEKTKRRIVLFSKGEKPEVLHRRTYHGMECLLSEREFRSLVGTPSEWQMQQIYKGYK